MASIMVQGTSSYSGKSFLVMSLCRIFRDKGVKVAPFKSQNTSLNSFVTIDGKEISRAQALQAFSAGIEPSVEMNPILIKPSGESRSQIVALGKPYMDIDAGDYYKDFALKEGLKIAKKAYRALERKYELIIIEGAGSPAEINLYSQDIANMRIADLADAPVILIADIERGGVFASIFGTLALLKREHKKRVKGIVINKFRGDIKILEPGIEEIEKLTKRTVLGVIPYIEGLRLPEEDSVSLQDSKKNRGIIKIAVIRLPRISNFSDFDPLLNDGIDVRYTSEPEELKFADAIIIPGTKNTIEDLKWLRDRGFEKNIRSLYGTVPIIGICGGYQMLGNVITDESGDIKGIGLLDVETRFEGYHKTTRQVRGKVTAVSGMFDGMSGDEVYGYEIHMGKTELGRHATPVFELENGKEGAIDDKGQVFGTYLHGIFDSRSFREGFLRFLGVNANATANLQKEIWDESIDRAADVVSNSIDISRLEEGLDV